MRCVNIFWSRKPAVISWNKQAKDWF